MAARPTPTPPWLPDAYGGLLSRSSSPEAEAAIGQADNRKHYLAWHEFRRRPVPEGWTAEELWTVVHGNRLVRSTNLTELQDKRGKHFRLVRSPPLEAALHRVDTREVLWADLLGARLEPGGRASEVTYQLMGAIEEAHASSAIEGAVTTKRQAREMIRSGREPRNRSERMVLNNFATIRRLDEWIGSPLTPQMLLDIQTEITAGTMEDPADAGRFRRDDKVRVVDATTGETVHQPPPSAELAERMERLCEFANRNSQDGGFLHPIVRGILLHHQLAYDHPFVDGNGRTARALFLWSVLRARYWWFRSLSISRAVNNARGAYYRSFVHVQANEGDVTYFVRQQLRCIELEIERLSTFLAERQRIAEWTHERLDLQSKLNARQLAIVAYALEHQGAVFTAAEHGGFHGVSQPTAWKDLSRMVALDLLVEHHPGGRKIEYRPSERLHGLLGESP